MRLADYEQPETLIRWFGYEAFSRALLHLNEDQIHLNRDHGDEQFFTYRVVSGRVVNYGNFLFERDEDPALHVNCKCGEGASCGHGLAAFMQAVLNGDRDLMPIWQAARRPSDHLPREVRQWLQALPTTETPAAATASSSVDPDAERTEIVFIAIRPDGGPVATVLRTVRATRYKQKPGFSKNAPEFGGWQTLVGGSRFAHVDTYRYGGINTDPVDWIPAAQRRVAKELFLADALPNERGVLMLEGKDGGAILPLIAANFRLTCDHHQAPALSVGNPRTARVEWIAGGASGTRRLTLAVEPAADILLPTDPPWYVDVAAGELGPTVGVPFAVASSILKAPDVPIAALPAFTQTLAKLPVASRNIPPPQPVERVGRRRPVPILTLGPNATGGAKVKLSFDYDGTRASDGSDEPLAFERDGKLFLVERDSGYERECVEQLHQQGLLATFSDGLSFLLGQRPQNARDETLTFQRNVVPALRANNWVVQHANDSPFRLAESTEWEVQLDPAEPGWFEVALGIEIDGVKVDLAAIIRDLLRQRDIRDLLRGKSTGDFYYEYRPTEFIAVPLERLRQVAALLLDLESLEEGERPRISRLDLGWMDAALGINGLSLYGHETITGLADRLAKAPKDVPVCVPDHPEKPFWPAQRAGVGWLQALLREDLGGVLADDMGLGKTRIVLSHVLAEVLNHSNGGRPTLGVVPTTAFMKWEEESACFTPQLRLLRVHGSSREADYARLVHHDLALISYDTLTNDIDRLAEIEWHVVFCDEGHRIGNLATQRTRAILQLQARQRLVISGTPMQNRSEEYFSLFNFAVPGLLRNRPWFRAHFVNKQGGDDIEASRMRLLGQLTAPFVRRTPKSEVAEELPELTVKKFVVEISGAQRQLYETVRLRLDKEVRAEIAAKGLARSQIAVLAAILQLRQVCSDPSLLTIPGADQIPSAKLEALSALVAELVAGGHRPIIFSQWTEMLKRIGERLTRDGVSYELLTGKQSIHRRKLAERNFRAGHVQTLLLSLKVGGEIIDLPEANNVILFDPWWNPLAEQQAIKRAHRQGQKNPVLALRMIVQGSVEEGVLAMGQRKAALAEALFEGTESGVAGLTMDDIDFLFRPLSSND